MLPQFLDDLWLCSVFFHWSRSDVVCFQMNSDVSQDIKIVTSEMMAGVIAFSPFYLYLKSDVASVFR